MHVQVKIHSEGWIANTNSQQCKASPDAKIHCRICSHPLRPKFIQEAILEKIVDCQALKGALQGD